LTKKTKNPKAEKGLRIKIAIKK